MAITDTADTKNDQTGRALPVCLTPDAHDHWQTFEDAPMGDVRNGPGESCSTEFTAAWLATPAGRQVADLFSQQGSGAGCSVPAAPREEER